MQKPSPAVPAIEELTLEWIPPAMRTKMDQAHVRISLAQWQLLAMPQRELLASMSADPAAGTAEFVQALQGFLAAAGADPAWADDPCRKLK